MNLFDLHDDSPEVLGRPRQLQQISGSTQLRIYTPETRPTLNRTPPRAEISSLERHVERHL